MKHGRLSVSLHWVIAVLFFGLVALGAWMTELGYLDRWATDALYAHRALGIALLVLACAKLATARRVDPTGIKPWEAVAARATHWTLFLLLLAVPISGYVISTSAGDAVPLVAGLSVPALFEVSDRLRGFCVAFHYWAAYGGAALAGLHAAAALKHHFIDRNDVLRRMTW